MPVVPEEKTEVYDFQALLEIERKKERLIELVKTASPEQLKQIKKILETR